MTLVACQTETCPSQGIEVEVDLTFVDEDGQTQTVDGVACGACGQPITNPNPR
jgi:NAD-dependent dihydropyrimidine dehydrogenase PreA subunit